MATQLKKVVAPSGGDYTSLEACMNANEQNLVTADKYFDVEISGTWSSADTTAVTIHNYTTDATRYINIYTTGAARHDGTAYKSGAYVNHITWNSQYGAGNIEFASDLYCTLDGVVLRGTFNANYHSCISVGSSTVDLALFVKNCIIFNDGTSSLNSAISCRSGNYYNNIIYGKFDYAAGNKYSAVAGSFYNNVVHGASVYGIRWQASNYRSSNIRNNIFYGNATDCCISNENYATLTTSNNISSDTSSPDASYRSKTLSFVSTTSGSEDFHLVSTDTDAIDHGADLSAIFTTDIDGTTRSGTWDIGADEYSGGGTGFMTTNSKFW